MRGTVLSIYKFVMPGLVPGIHVLVKRTALKTWMAGLVVQTGDIADTCSET